LLCHIYALYFSLSLFEHLSRMAGYKIIFFITIACQSVVLKARYMLPSMILIKHLGHLHDGQCTHQKKKSSMRCKMHPDTTTWRSPPHRASTFTARVVNQLTTIEDANVANETGMLTLGTETPFGKPIFLTLHAWRVRSPWPMAEAVVMASVSNTELLPDASSTSHGEPHITWRPAD